ncbi:MAG: hypothetical protein LBT97_02215, partial [Planctomycetota bacterium]|nr:hypothetical protein [Planctomycetota bacterium]
ALGSISFNKREVSAFSESRLYPLDTRLHNRKSGGGWPDFLHKSAKREKGQINYCGETRFRYTMRQIHNTATNDLTAFVSMGCLLLTFGENQTNRRLILSKVSRGSIFRWNYCLVGGIARPDGKSTR